jgi:hypothetical protein
MVTQTSELVSIRTRHSQTLMLKGERLCRQSFILCSMSEDQLRHSQLQSTASRLWVREQRTHWASKLGPIIRQKLRNGWLPLTRPARIFGGPGAGGQCAACNCELGTNQLVMELPTCDAGVLFLHGDCFIVWDAERAALRAIAIEVSDLRVM